ncbi:protein argonaute 18-like isoform X3 [Panicum virgatum]|uniref:Uncharacterized protein n=1 Tax=Panicum virgatum TaxID=38727 RepID=A0A8T0VJB5_PANVG|nr:protein argonaute 18-like isoform X3 [Panicum virgatum]KAG2636871.1 hypothetical protein PVAP13_2NG477400 [Panicum virgatum]
MPPGNHHGGGRRGGHRRIKASPSCAEKAGDRDDHHDDDRGRADQSQHADPRQTLVASDAEKAAAAAPLLEEFAALGIQVRRAEPVFPPRPGYGAAGTPCVVRANRFLARFVDEGLHHYDVNISPDPTPKGEYMEVMSKLVSENQHTELGGRFPAYDGCGSLFTAGALPFDTKVFKVTLSACADKRRMRARKYKVVIKHAAAISLLQLRMLLAGYPTDIPAQALQVLDNVLRDVVFNKRDDMEYIAVGRSFFSQKLGCAKDGTLGVEAWKGLYESIRPMQNGGLSVLVDVSSSVFIEPLLLIDFVQKTLKIDANRKLTKPDHAKLLKAVRGVRIEVTHRGSERRKYRITGLSMNPTKVLSFKSPSGATKTVIDYFREKYNLKLKFNFLPCLNVGSEQKPVYLPIEVCKIVPRQRYQKKLDGSQVSTLRKSTCQFQPEQQSICQVVESKQHNGTKHANEFGIDVDDNLTTINARVLPPPNLKYHDSGSEKTWSPMNGHWNMKDKKVVNGAKIRNWACVNFCEDLSKNVVEQFCFKLAEISRITGVELADLKLPIFTTRPDQVEDDIRICYQEAQKELIDQKIDLLLAILPDNNGSLYGNVKKICETDIGVMSQCCRKSIVFTKYSKILANIAIKINAKAGGRNSVFEDAQKSLPVVSNKPTIIFGAHVTHPSVVDHSAPSIASVVASQDWHEVDKYNGVVRAQGQREEMISGLENMVKELLHAFEKESNRKPQQLIFYRDGVSWSQLKQVFEKEIPEIEKAWKALYNNEKPQITFIAVQKRHSLMLFPNNNNQYHNANRKNVEPGTVVDSEICHPAEFDFFLCSYAEVKGPSHPVQYLVLRDDNNFTADELQALTNNLCYTHASFTKAMMIAPPAHYARKLAQRAHLYLAQDPNAAKVASSCGATAPAGGLKQLPEIKDELKRSMFYC